jgi:hypothetical protein
MKSSLEEVLIAVETVCWSSEEVKVSVNFGRKKVSSLRANTETKPGKNGTYRELCPNSSPQSPPRRPQTSPAVQ